MKRCAVIVYRSRFWTYKATWRHFSVDCEQHEHSTHSLLFADAVAEAMIHRFEASR